MVELRKPRRGRRSVPYTLPAPVGGLNGIDGLAEMPPKDAFILDNWFPRATTVDTRGGSASFVTGIVNPVESLEVYAGGATQKMLAFAGGAVYDVSNTGAVGAAIVSGKNSNKISSAMFSNAGAQYLIGLTGNDAPFSYDGTTYTALTITGLTGVQNTLHGILAFKGRLFFAQKDQLGFYYLAAGAIQGAASYFDLSQIAKRGGYLKGMASFSSDSGNGPADYCVFMTSEGEYLVYGGTDPSNAATWSLVGRYYGPAPIGRKGWFNYRADLYIISLEGIFAFSQLRSEGEDADTQKYLTAKLGRAWTDLNVNSANHGWCAVVYPRSQMLVVNAPATTSPSGAYYQYVMNSNTNAWCRFTNWNGLSFVVFKDRLYFGQFDGKIILADEGYTDQGADIKADCRQAYNYFDDGKGMGSSDKQFHFATFIMQGDGTPPISAELCVNFEDDFPDYIGALSAVSGAVWDVSSWDIADWAGDGVTQNFTTGFGKLGYVASIWLRTSIATSPLRWYATRIIMEKSQGLVLL